MQFEVKAADADAVLNDIRTGANVLRYSVNENPDTANVTTAKQAFVVQIIPLAQVPPRLTTNLNLAASDVESSYRAILKRVTDAGGRVISSNLNRADATQAVGNIQFELKSEQADAVRNDITKGVQVLQLSVAENPDSANVTTAKQVFVVQIIPTSQVAPRETRTLSVETSEVETAMQNLTSAVAQAGGRTLESNLSQDANGRTVAQLSVEVPLDKADALIDVAKGQGKVRTAESSKNTQVPDGPLARARLNLTIGTGETIVAAADGFWPRLRGGLSTSVNGLLWSFELIVIGLCLVGPWALLIWGGWRFLRSKRSSSTVV
jgi:glycine cleavage system regulatory protein